MEIINTIKTIILNKTGAQIKSELGIPQHFTVVIQRIINQPNLIYLLTYNSRVPTMDLTTSRLKQNKAMQLKRPKKSLFGISLGAMKLTPAVDIDYVKPSITSQSLFILYDMAGEYMRDKSIKENTKNKLNLILYKDLED